MIACTWDHPGADRYTGTVAAAVAAYHYPVATQRALVAAWEQRRWDDIVAIDRDSIRGQHVEYDSEIRSMHFGSAGRVCDTVTRTAWSPVHVETAIVVCADGLCVGIPSVCGNVFQITRREAAAAPGPAYETLGGGVDPTFPPNASPTVVGWTLPALPPDAVAATWASAAGIGWAGGGGGYCTCCGAAPVAAVPELATWVLFGLGFGAYRLMRIKRK